MPDSEMTAAEQKAHDEALKRIAECLRRRASVLDLSRLGLSCLPGKMGQLPKLSELNLAHNRLRTLPPEVCQLENLSRLDISNNQLAALPPELGQLASLTLLEITTSDSPCSFKHSSSFWISMGDPFLWHTPCGVPLNRKLQQTRM